MTPYIRLYTDEAYCNSMISRHSRADSAHARPRRECIAHIDVGLGVSPLRRGPNYPRQFGSTPRALTSLGQVWHVLGAPITLVSGRIPGS